MCTTFFRTSVLWHLFIYVKTYRMYAYNDEVSIGACLDDKEKNMKGAIFELLENYTAKYDPSRLFENVFPNQYNFSIVHSDDLCVSKISSNKKSGFAFKLQIVFSLSENSCEKLIVNCWTNNNNVKK